jgi:hypothetical protein
VTRVPRLTRAGAAVVLAALLAGCSGPSGDSVADGPASGATSALARAQAEADTGRARRAAAGAAGIEAANAYAVAHGVAKAAPSPGADVLGPPDENGFADLDWTKMVPPEDFKALENAPPVLHVGNQRMKQIGTLHTVEALNGAKVRLSGYVVPLESDSDGNMVEFFFVPFYGACIHVPPPPPNMLVHVRLSHGIPTPSLYDPLTLKGVLHTQVTENPLAASAYAVDNGTLEAYSNSDDDRLRRAFE